MSINKTNLFFRGKQLVYIIIMLILLALLAKYVKFKQKTFEYVEKTTINCIQIFPLVLEDIPDVPELNEEEILESQLSCYKDRNSINILQEPNCSIYIDEIEVYQLGKIIAAEAASIPDDYYEDVIFYQDLGSYPKQDYESLVDFHQQLVGYAVINRVASDDYPDTIEGVFYYDDAYATTSRIRYENEFVTDRCLKNARIVLQNYYANTIPVPENMIYQAEFQQGIPFIKLGRTCFGLDK